MAGMGGKLRWAVCTAGRISTDFAEVLFQLPSDQHKMVAVAARHMTRAQDFAKKFGMQKAYDSYSALASDLDVNIVYVGATNDRHFDLCKKYLEAGKNVLCEKPLSISADQARKLVALSEAKRLLLMEGMWTRCFPIMQQLRNVIDSGEIGVVKGVEVSFMKDAMEQERVVAAELGGGAMLDLGAYALHFIDFVMRSERPKQIHAVGGLYPKTGVDETLSAVLQYDGGRFAQFTVSMRLRGGDKAVVHGERGTIVVWPPFFAPSKLTVFSFTPGDEPKSRVITSQAPAFQQQLRLTPAFNYPHSAGLIYEAQHVRECVVQGLWESPLVPHSSTILVMELIDECLRQIRPTRQVPTTSQIVGQRPGEVPLQKSG